VREEGFVQNGWTEWVVGFLAMLAVASIRGVISVDVAESGMMGCRGNPPVVARRLRVEGRALLNDAMNQ
jgi:hypothetical protein